MFLHLARLHHAQGNIGPQNSSIEISKYNLARKTGILSQILASFSVCVRTNQEVKETEGQTNRMIHHEHTHTTGLIT